LQVDVASLRMMEVMMFICTIVEEARDAAAMADGEA
jgi:hypothetical protein